MAVEKKNYYFILFPEIIFTLESHHSHLEPELSSNNYFVLTLTIFCINNLN